MPDLKPMSDPKPMFDLKPMIETAIAFVRRSGLQLLDAGPGYAQCRMPLTGNENHLGSMYAGAQFTLADITGGALALASFDPAQYYPTLKQLKLDFLKPARSDLTLEYRLDAAQLAVLHSEAERAGKAGFLLQGELKDGDGVTVATASGEFQVRMRAR